MKITEDTPSRFTITCRRPVLADIVLLVIALLGAGFTYVVAVSEITPLTPVFLVFGIGFAALGAWGLLYNAHASVTFDATARTITFHWRKLFRTERRDLTFADLRDVTVEDDDNMHTLLFWPRNGAPIPLERAYTTNRAAFDVARRLENWLAGDAQ